MRQAAWFAIAPEAVVENRLAWKRDLDDCAKVCCVIDDMIRDERSEGSHQIVKRRQSATARRGPLEPQRGDVGPRGRGKCHEGKEQRTGQTGTLERRCFRGRSMAGCAAERERDERPSAVVASERKRKTSEKPKGTSKGKSKAGGKVKGNGKKASLATCAEDLDTPHCCAPVRDGSTTLTRKRLTERTRTMTVVGKRKRMRHSSWSTSAVMLTR